MTTRWPLLHVQMQAIHRSRAQILPSCTNSHSLIIYFRRSDYSHMQAGICVSEKNCNTAAHSSLLASQLVSLGENNVMKWEGDDYK